MAGASICFIFWGVIRAASPIQSQAIIIIQKALRDLDQMALLKDLTHIDM